ncbi:MAG: hypothetical protein HZB42_00615 [Sphingobacteriales bacterium]|nr:hypothetical protein [Sphingobacteriales bacterium]
MRKFLFTLSVFTFLYTIAGAQAPAFFNYQGVARNSVGNALVNKTIGLRLTIHDGGGGTGIPVYSETRIVTTNAFGLFNVQVGGAGATNVSGTIVGVNWKLGAKFMQIEIDPDGGTSFKDVGTTRLTSVPYSLYSNQTGDIVLPFNKSQNEENPLFKLINTGNTGSSLAFEGISNSTANNAAAMRGIIASPSPGVFSAAVMGQNNGTGNNGIGVYGTQNGTGWGVYGTTPGGIGVYGNSNTGIGVYGQSAAFGASVMGFKDNNGQGNAGLFRNISPINFSPVLSVQSVGPGDGINVSMTGLGNGGIININNTANLASVFTATGNGLGKTGSFQNINAGNNSNVLEAISNGVGRVGFFQNTNAANTSDALTSVTNGSGWALGATHTGTNGAGIFIINNANNNAPAVLRSTTNGLGRSAFFDISNSSSSANALEVATNGTGYAAFIQSTNATAKALRTVGAIQFTGVSEGPGKVLATVDGSGNATWQNAASVGLVSGSGTLNFVPKWTPNGTFIGNSQIFDNGAKISIGGAIDTYYDVNINKTLKVNASAQDTAVAIFENTNGNLKSDGIIIKLGRTHPRWNGSSYANVANPMTGQLTTQMDQIRDWIYGNDSFSWNDLINLIPNQAVVGTVCQLTNYITANINSALGLPLRIGPYSTPGWSSGDLFTWGGYHLGLPSPLPDINIGGFTVPGVTIPSLPVIPQVTVMPAIPQIPCGSLQSFSFPNFVFNDVTNTLSKENEYISFLDKDNRKLGAIRAQSIQNFSYDYFDGQKLLEIAGELIGVDLADDFVSLIAGVSEMAVDYNNIGVEYSSGNGDYAEWLERSDVKETISFGDIVGVKGGKISKDLSGAEQVMAVSKNPIVLGNIPDASKTNTGNNIAFMGQIPVKVIGAVQSGDYIVAKSEVPGYGVAVHPKDMTVDDFKLSVGRSWDTNLKEGPKMVNTVVGVHNNDFLNIIANLQKKSEQTDERLKAIETILSGGNGVKEQPKKAFK